MMEYYQRMMVTANADFNLEMMIREVKHLTTDALFLLLSFLKSTYTYGKGLRTDIPEDENCAKLLFASGFMKQFNITSPYDGDHSYIYFEKENTVKKTIAQNARRFATLRTLGKDVRNRPIVSALIDLMQNTSDHAHPT